MENNVYYKLTEDERALMNKVVEATCGDYEINELYIPIENLMCAIEDLFFEYDHVKEELEDTIRDREDNWRPIPYEEQI